MSRVLPTIGDTVIYFPDKNEQLEMEKYGNSAKELPATVVASWGQECVNLKVATDGTGPDLWKTSAVMGKGEEGSWMWPYKYHDL